MLEEVPEAKGRLADCTVLAIGKLNVGQKGFGQPSGLVVIGTPEGPVLSEMLDERVVEGTTIDVLPGKAPVPLHFLLVFTGPTPIPTQEYASEAVVTAAADVLRVGTQVKQVIAGTGGTVELVSAVTTSVLVL